MYVIHYNNIILILILYQQLDFSHVYIFNSNKNDVGIEKLLLDKKVYKCSYFIYEKKNVDGKISSNLLSVVIIHYFFSYSYCNELYFPRCSSTVNLIYEKGQTKKVRNHSMTFSKRVYFTIDSQAKL